MIGLDTNVLVRYLARDDAVQSPKATQIIEHQLTEERPGFINLVTMVETVWVLDRAYGLSSREIAETFERLYRNDGSEDRSRGFPGRAYWALGTRAGCTATLTFDKKAKRLRHFRLL